MKINYKEIPFAELGRVKLLWEKLRIHHYERAKDFKNYFEKITFEERQKKLFKGKKEIKVFVAEESVSSQIVGYCIASISEDNSGEIDSIYIEGEYRKLGIGRAFIERLLDWFTNNQITDIVIEVAIGNEEALPFYEQLGFVPRTYRLKKKNNN